MIQSIVSDIPTSSLAPLRENGRLPCVKMFAVRFSSGARQTSTLPCVFWKTHDKQKRTVPTYFAVRFYGGARQSQFFAVRFSMDARQLLHTNGWAPQPYGLLTGVKLCRAPWKNARQIQEVCRAFCCGARQCIFKN
jgi:hypothetical protein